MPVYRTGPDIALDDLVEQIQARGEKIVAIDREDGERIIVTEWPDVRTMIGKPEKRS